MQGSQETVKDDCFRVENVHGIAKGDAQIHELAGDFVVHFGAVAVPERLFEVGGVAAAQAGQFQEPGLGDFGFQAARGAAVAGAASGADEGVAEFPGVAGGAPEQPSVRDDPAADAAGATVEIDQIPLPGYRIRRRRRKSAQPRRPGRRRWRPGTGSRLPRSASGPPAHCASPSAVRAARRRRRGSPGRARPCRCR